MRPRWSSAVGGPAALVSAGVLLLLLLASPIPTGATSVIGVDPCPITVRPVDSSTRFEPPPPTPVGVVLPHSSPSAQIAVFEGVAAARVETFPPAGWWEPTERSVWAFTVDRVLSGSLEGRVVQVLSPPTLPTDAQGHVIEAFTIGERYRIKGLPDNVTGTANTPASYLRPLCAEVAPPSERRADVAPTAPAPRIATTSLGVFGLLGLGLTAAATCLRWRELELEERELALREREATRRAGPGGS